MVHAIDMQTVAKAGANYQALTDLLLQVHRHANGADADLALDLIQANDHDKAIALALESLCYHLKGDQATRVRAHLEHALSLDLFFFFLAVPDTDLVVNAACDLLQAWIAPYPPARLLENEDLLVQGLAHPNENVRILVLRQLAKLNAPGDWTPALALAAVQSIHTESIPVFDAFIQLMANQETATTLFTSPQVMDFLESQLLTHRIRAFSAIEILGRLVRFSLSLFPNAPCLLSNLFSTRILHNPLDYAAFCHHAAQSLLPTSQANPGNPANAATLLTNTGILSTVLDRTQAKEEPESGLPLLLALVALDPAHPLSQPILDTAVTFIQTCASDDNQPRDRTILLALATLRALADALSDCTPILHHPALVRSLSTLFSTVHGGSTRDALLVHGVLQFLAAMAPKPLGDSLTLSLMPVTPPGTQADHVLQPWVALAVAATTHVQPEVQSAGYVSLQALADTDWGWRALVLDTRITYLLTRSAADSPLAKRIKYEVVQRLAHWVGESTGEPPVDPSVKPRLDLFVKQGPYYTPRVANVAVDEAV